jgi:hypothetical protein
MGNHEGPHYFGNYKKKQTVVCGGAEVGVEHVQVGRRML